MARIDTCRCFRRLAFVLAAAIICGATGAFAAEGLRLEPLSDADIDHTVALTVTNPSPAFSTIFAGAAMIALAAGLAIMWWLFHRQRRRHAAALVRATHDVMRRRQETDELHLAMQAAREAHAEADEANRAKGEFLASMSHEVRTPLNAILGFADLMLAMPDLSATGRRHAERIRGGGDALLKIVDDILDLSRAEAGALQLDSQPFSLPLLVDECLSLVEHAALAKSLSLRVDLADRFPTGLVGDEGRLRQILLNLLNNAIKFTRQGHVTLRIHYDRGFGPSMVRFEVNDTGIGIAAGDLPRLFQRFGQVDGSIRRTYGGTGLGLAICKTLVERMGGTIGVRSEKGAGSTFWFAIDLPTTPLVLEPPVLAPPTRRVLDLLLVEDVVVNQELACAILRAKGHKVDVVGDGAEAIMAATDKTYDLVLMDVQMPHVDGLTATRAIRNLPVACRFVPIVAMTAAVLADQVAAARAAGMDDVLAKPLSLAALDALLERAERDAVRPPVDPEAFDPTVVAKLVATIGEAKVAAMQSLLLRSLATRLVIEPSPENLAELKAEAHASIAGAGMLGFTRFGPLCRAFIAAQDQPAAEAAFARLRCELYQVVRTLEAMAFDREETARRSA